MALVEFLQASYLKAQLDRLSNLNISLTDLRDGLRGTDSRTLTDIYNKLSNIGGSVSVANLPAWFTGSTKTTDDLFNKLNSLTNALSSVATDSLRANVINAISVGNFPSWFTGSTKLTDDLFNKLDALSKALGSVAQDSLRVSLISSLPSGTNWIGRVWVGDGTNAVSVISGTLAGSSRYLLGVAPDMTKVFAGGTNYTEQAVNVTTTESSSSFSPPLRAVMLTNTGDVDIIIKLNGGTTQKILYAKTSKVIVFYEISSISYKVASGSSTLVIEGYW